ncbi:MAG TPA: molybdopterin cofactor-binding domain-containing protein [Steroidobacteraceae bacterium]|nr:molybdopterin cofactor-binding domain-containing protein [Steroidobacteraceae bacterium]
MKAELSIHGETRSVEADPDTPRDLPRTAMRRREFIVATGVIGGGMALGFVHAEGATEGPAAAELTPWIVIGADNIVTVRVPGPESGTGNSTQAAMFVAEELQCDWNNVRVEPISFNRNTREGNLYLRATGIWSTFAGAGASGDVMKTLMQAGASARERLRAAAAAQWKVPVKEIEAKSGVLFHAHTKRQARYGEVAARAAAIKLPKEPAPKPREQWTLLTRQTLPMIHARSVVNGSSVFGIDVRLPGMLYAALLQCPVHGGRLQSYDFEKIKDMPGVRGVAVVDPDEPRRVLKKPAHWANTSAQSGIAVIAEHYWQARQALEALPVTWDLGSGAQWKTTQQIYDALYARLKEPAEDLLSDVGDAPRFIDAADAEVVEATYLTPFCDHATMEPLNGTALVTADRVDLWHPAAMVVQALVIATEETGVPAEKVHFHQTLVGGSFGRRVNCDDVRMVLAVAKRFPGTPIHVMWSREETFRQGKYRDLHAARMRAALGSDGLPQALISHVAAWKPVMFGMSDSVYVKGSIPHVRIETSSVETHILTGQYRGPGYNSHCFFVECFIDECAARAGIEPLEYRLRLLAKWPDAGWRKCLEVAARQAGWGTPLPAGQGRGIAIGNFGGAGEPHAGMTVAAVATVEITVPGELRVQSLDIAFDCGQVLNIDAVRSQLEGSAVFGMNMSLNEEITIENGRVVEGNFDTYPMLRLADVPRINIHLDALSGHDRYANAGEAGVGVIGPAIANAVFAATRVRLRSMPFRKLSLRAENPRQTGQ